MIHHKFRLAACVLCIVVATNRDAKADLPVPAGLQPGDTYHLLFNSSTFTNALSSSIDYYNDFVQSAADAAGIGASEGVLWNAIASTASVDARVNAFVGANTPIYNTKANDLQKIADGFDDLWDGTIDQFPEYNQFGAFNGVDPWTGSTPNGLRASGLTLGHFSGTAWCGRPGQLNGQWLAFTTPPTNFPLTLYALSEELTVPDGDFNSDGDVDGDDFLLWQRGNGDANDDGVTNSTDLEFWSQQYGRSSTGTSQSLSAVSAVPEPTSVVLFFAATIIAAASRSRYV